MARARNIKPGFFKNDLLAEIDPLGRLLFAGLWTIADREGRLEDRPKKIKAETLPYDDCDVDKLLDDLFHKGFIIRYEVDGTRYIAIRNWASHQKPHIKEQPSTIPAPTQIGASTVQETEEHQTSRPDSLNPITDSFNLTTDCLNPGPELEVAVSEIYQGFEQMFGRAPNPIQLEKLQWYVDDGMETALVLYAMEQTRVAGKDIRYTFGILNNLVAQGIYTLEAAKEAEDEYKNEQKNQFANKRSSERERVSIDPKYNVFYEGMGISRGG